MISRPHIYIGLFLISLSTLMYEILLTRIFSVITLYHFAFMAISIAMFGLTVGATLVYIFPNYFSRDRTQYHLALSALLFSVSIILSSVLYLRLPLQDLGTITFAFSIISVPFVFSGICICLALTKFPQQVSKLYAADLAGAAMGCVLLLYVLDITGAPTAILVVSILGGIGTLFFCAEGNFPKLSRMALIFSLLFSIIAGIHIFLVQDPPPFLRLIWVKGSLEGPTLYEKWNSFSRIRVFGDPTGPRQRPFGWGLSPSYPYELVVKELGLNIDANAYTVLTSFDGDLKKLEYLKYDITNLVHYLRPNAKTLVIGMGGGRDILSALVFKQKSVVGIEINKDIIEIVNQRFGDFTGRLDERPEVIVVNDEARSYLARSPDRFDIIQASLIDTFAASTAGAFALAENALYTIEGWKIFLEHLEPNGILTFSRWYRSNNPAEIYRLTSLASASLENIGIKHPRNHLLLVRCMVCQDHEAGVGTILVSKEPFSVKDINTIQILADRMQFQVALSPSSTLDPVLGTLASGENLDAFTKKFPENISAPTDDSPFFFNMDRMRNVVPKLWGLNLYGSPMGILGILLIGVFALTLLCIIIPLILRTDITTMKGSLPLLIYFSGIGFGFILIEISQMQRLVIFLGHPTYSLSVVLFALLLSSGLGSYLTDKIATPGIFVSVINRLLILLLMLVVFGSLTSYVINAIEGSITPVRIAVATGILFILGLFMGMAFPMGMKMASSNNLGHLTPWFWGMNGATSVCGSVLAVAIALESGISTAFWTGFSWYVVSVIAVFWMSRRKGQITT